MTHPRGIGGAGSPDAALVRRAMSRAGQSRPVPGNDVRLLHDGPAAFDAMLAAIAGARHRIHFENYIIRSDRTGWRFAEALAERAREGVTVRVLYDWLGCMTTSRRLWRHLRGHGVEVRAFNPPRPVDVFANVTRDHRKLVVADGAIGVVGGICIGDEWAGRPDRGTLPWRDTAIRVAGPAAAALDQTFGAMWNLAGDPLPADEAALDVEPAGPVEVQVVSGRPGRGRIFRVLDLLAAGVTDRIWITDAYLVVPPRLLYALRNAAWEGVDVRLLVPSTSDISLVRNMTRIGYRSLLESGIRIFEWRGAMLHAKTQVADARWSRIGSSNLNAASLLGNYELDVLIDDRAVAVEMERQFRRDLAQAAEVVLPERPGGRLGRRWLPRLAEAAPATTPEPHRAGLRERRRRAVLALRTVSVGARRSLFIPVALGLVLLAALFLALPTFTAYLAGGALAWLSGAAWLEAFRRRGGARDGP